MRLSMTSQYLMLIQNLSDYLTYVCSFLFHLPVLFGDPVRTQDKERGGVLWVTWMDMAETT